LTRVYKRYCCRTRKVKISFSDRALGNSINADYAFCKTIKNPFEWFGTRINNNNRHHLPSYHPVWTVLVGMHQYSRIPQINDAIKQTEAFIESVKDVCDFNNGEKLNIDVYNKAGAASEMINQMKQSIEGIKNKYGFKIIKNAENNYQNRQRRIIGSGQNNRSRNASS